MQSVSADYKRIQKANDKVYETKLVIDDVGEFDEHDLMSVSTSIEMFHGSPTVGTAVSQEINVSMLMPSVSIPRMACLRPYIRVKGTAPKSSAVTIANEKLSSTYASYSSGKVSFASGSGVSVVGEAVAFPADGTEELTSEWIPQGVFYIDTRKVSANYNGIPVLTLHGFDAMLKAEQDYSSNETVGDAKDKAYVQSIADSIGVEVDPRTWEVMGQGRVIPMPLGYTMREILGYIASAYVGAFVMTEQGKLRLVSLLGLPSYDDTHLLCTNDRYVILFGGDAIKV